LPVQRLGVRQPSGLVMLNRALKRLWNGHSPNPDLSLRHAGVSVRFATAVSPCNRLVEPVKTGSDEPLTDAQFVCGSRSADNPKQTPK
jgi:hypothetical protein